MSHTSNISQLGIEPHLSTRKELDKVTSQKNYYDKYYKMGQNRTLRTQFFWMKNHKTSFRANSDDDIGKNYWLKFIIDRKKTSNVTTWKLSGYILLVSGGRWQVALMFPPLLQTICMLGPIWVHFPPTATISITTRAANEPSRLHKDFTILWLLCCRPNFKSMG